MFTFAKRFFRSSSLLQRIETFLIPQPGEGIVEVEILEWASKPGTFVKEFEILCEARSDKGFIEYKSEYDGQIKEIFTDVDNLAEVGSALYTIEIDDEKYPKVVKNKQVEIAQKQETNIKISNKKVLAAPVIRKLAKDQGVDITNIQGSGPQGRILEIDIIKPVVQPIDFKAEIISSSEGVIHNITGVQKGMIKSMTEALKIPHLTYSEIMVMDELIKMREKLRDVMPEGVKLTYMPFFIKALSLAISQYPIVNSSLNIQNGQYIQYPHHNITIAINSPLGLLVPNIKNVQDKSLIDIAQDLQRLAQLGTDGRLTENDMKDGTIALSNIGAIGGTYTRPVILPPQVVIGATGGMQKQLVLDNGVIREQFYICSSWSADHRIIDGATVARFVSSWKRFLEKPESILGYLR